MDNDHWLEAIFDTSRVYVSPENQTYRPVCVVRSIQHVDLLDDLLITTILIDNLKKLLRTDVKMSCGNDFRPLHVTASTNSMKQMCVSLCMKKVSRRYSRSTYSS